MGIYCPKCQSHAFRSGNYCYVCGTPLIENLKCDSCGKERSTADKFCVWCGEKVPTQEDIEKREALGLMRQDQENDLHDCHLVGGGGESGCDHPIHKDQPEP